MHADISELADLALVEVVHGPWAPAPAHVLWLFHVSPRERDRLFLQQHVVLFRGVVWKCIINVLLRI